jgi:hypothetical protein
MQRAHCRERVTLSEKGGKVNGLPTAWHIHVSDAPPPVEPVEGERNASSCPEPARRSASRLPGFGGGSGVIGWGGRIRTSECRDQNPVTYRLSTPHQHPLGSPQHPGDPGWPGRSRQTGSIIPDVQGRGKRRSNRCSGGISSRKGPGLFRMDGALQGQDAWAEGRSYFRERCRGVIPPLTFPEPPGRCPPVPALSCTHPGPVPRSCGGSNCSGDERYP